LKEVSPANIHKASVKTEAEKEMEQEKIARELVKQQLGELEKIDAQRKKAASAIPPAAAE
jgi:hypothetical protein